jgi:hypothetical protein
MKIIFLATVIATTLVAGTAMAEDNRSCTKVSNDKWLTEDAVKAKAAEAGYDVRKLKIEGSCYEVYAIDAKGNKVEALFDPATGLQVGNENEGDD